MKKRIITAAAALAAAACMMDTTAFACTAFYVGRDVSEDGSVIIARTEDMLSAESKRFIVHPAADHKKGEKYTDAFGLSVEYPAHTYRYTAVPGSEYRGIGETPFGEAGFNECGVAATSTVTAYPNKEALAADPLVKNGLYELSVNDIILSRAATAREGIEIIADIVDKYGSGEGNIIMTADADEAWYMEIYSGHQYAAMRLPDDKAAVIPNAYMLREFDPSAEDVIASEELESLPKEHNFIKVRNGRIDLRATYSVPDKETDKIRIWGGRRILYGNPGDDPDKAEHELLYTPKEKISVKDVMNASRYRYEDTDYSGDIEKNKHIRIIGTSRQEECNILQIRPDMDKEVGCIEWLCLGNCEFAPFVPYYAAALTDTPRMCRYDSMDYSEESMYWASRGLSTVCAGNRELYGNKVKEFFSKYEDSLIEDVKESDKLMTAAKQKTLMANRLCADNVYDLFNKQHAMYKELQTFIAAYDGEDEYRDNKLTFEPTLTPKKADFVSYTTDLPTVFTIDKGEDVR